MNKPRDINLISSLSQNSGIKPPLPIEGWIARDSNLTRFWFHPDVQDIIFEIEPERSGKEEFVIMWQALSPINLQVQEKGGLPIHAALVVKDGKGILLGAPGETGKSTCCRRLPPPWNPLCDDESIIVKDEETHYMVHPLPTWSNYILRRSEPTYKVEEFFPLAGIFFIEQSKTNEVVPIGQGQSIPILYRLAVDVYQITTWRYLERKEIRPLKVSLFNNISDMVKKVPTFILRVSLEGRFWDEIDKVLFTFYH
jgi:SynChlorMet cassette protein ScmC